MTDSSTPPRPQRAWLRRLLRAFGVLALLVVLAAVTYSWWLPGAVERFGPGIARRFGFELEIASVERLDLGGVRLSGLRLRELGVDPLLERIRVDELDAEFDRRLLTGDVRGLASLRGSGVEVVIALPASSQDEEPESSGEPFVFDWPEALPPIELEDVEVRIVPDEGATIVVTDASVRTGDDGALRADARFEERRLTLAGTYASAVIDGLTVGVDGLAALQDSRVDLTHVIEGALDADLGLALQADESRLQAQLAGGRVQWQLRLVDLDLESVPARLPFEFEQILRGQLDLASTGELAFDDLLGGTAEAQIDLEGFEYEGVEVASATGTLSLADGVLRIPTLDVRQSEWNRLAVADATLPLRGLDPANWLEDATAILDVEATRLQELLAPFDLLPPEGLAEHRLAFGARLADERLFVSEGGLTSAAGSVSLTTAEVWIDETGPLALALELDGIADVPDLARFGALLGRSDWGGAVRGTIAAQGTYPDVNAQLQLTGEDLRIEGQDVGQLELDVATSESLHHVEVTRLANQSPVGSLDARLVLDWGEGRYDLHLQELALRRNQRGLILQAPARIEYEPGRAVVSGLELRGAAGDLLAQGSWTPDRAELTLDVRELHPEVFLGGTEFALPALRTADFEARATLIGDRLQIVTDGTLTQLSAPGLSAPIDLAWDLLHDEERTTITSFTAASANGLTASVSGSLPIKYAPTLELKAGELALDLSMQLPLESLDLDSVLSGKVSVDGSLSGAWTELGGSLNLAGTGLVLPEGLQPAGLEAGSIAGTLRLEDGLVAENLSVRFGELLDLSLDARVDAPLDLTRWMSEPGRLAEEATAVGEAALTSFDVDRLEPLLEAYGVGDRLRAGQLSGGLRFEGPLLSPVLSGDLDITEGRLRVGGGLPSIDSLNASLHFVADRLTLESCTGTLGASPFELNGTVDLNEDDAVLDLSLRGDDLLLFRDRSARIRANTDLQLKGPTAALEVSGSLELTRGHYAPDQSFLNLRPGPTRSDARGFQLFSFREPPLRDMSFDVTLTAKKAFEIRNFILQGAVRPNLKLRGTGEIPILDGRVFLDTTAVTLPAGRLTITGGTVQFLRDNPFVPQIDAVGEARMIGYNIRANIAGPYDNPEILLSSTPPLSQETLLVLMLTGQLQESATNTDNASTASTVAVYIAKDTVARWFSDNGPINEDSVFERLELFYGEDVSQDGTETFDVAFRLSNKEGLPPERRNFRHWYMTAQRDRFEDYNYGLRIVFRLR